MAKKTEISNYIHYPFNAKEKQEYERPDTVLMSRHQVKRSKLSPTATGANSTSLIAGEVPAVSKITSVDNSLKQHLQEIEKTANKSGQLPKYDPYNEIARK